jgi:predicted transcriptional regulator
MSMDEETLRRRLAQAEARVTQGYRHLARQREIVRELQRDGRDAQEARSWLTQFEELHAIYVADRNRLLRAISSEREPSAWDGLSAPKPII